MTESGASLDPHRLSARKNTSATQSATFDREGIAKNGTDFEKLEKLPLTGKNEIRNVSANDLRRIESVKDAVKAHADYCKEKENAVLVLEEENEGEVRVLPYNHRWKEQYRKMTYAKLKAAERELNNIYGEGPIPTTLITLTSYQNDANGDPRPLGEVLQKMKEHWPKFKRRLDRLTEGRRTEYIAVWEPHQSGYPHLHIAVFGLYNPTLEKKVKDAWADDYNLSVRRALSVESRIGRSAQQLESPAAYLMKYISKTTTRKGGGSQKVEGFKAFSALLWVTGKRQWSASASLTQAMKRGESVSDPDASWRFIGVSHGLETGTFSGEMADKIVRYVKGSAAIWRPPGGKPPPDRSLSTDWALLPPR